MMHWSWDPAAVGQAVTPATINFLAARLSRSCMAALERICWSWELAGGGQTGGPAMIG